MECGVLRVMFSPKYRAIGMKILQVRVIVSLRQMHFNKLKGRGLGMVSQPSPKKPFLWGAMRVTVLKQWQNGDHPHTHTHAKKEVPVAGTPSPFDQM